MEIQWCIQSKENAISTLSKMLQRRGIGLCRIFYQNGWAIVPRPGSKEAVGCCGKLYG